MSIFLALALPLSAYAQRATAETAKQARARAEQYLKSPGGERPRGPDLDCSPYGEQPHVFSFYKLAFSDSKANPDLCAAVTAFGRYFQDTVSPYWPLKDLPGIEVRPIKSLEEFNAAFMMRPILNKQTLPYFSFHYLPGAPLKPQIPVWSHEAGHAALQEILDDHFYPIAAEAFLKMNEDRAGESADWKRLQSLQQEDDAIKLAWRNTNSSALISVFTLQQAALSFRIAALQNVLYSKDPLNSAIVGPFHEFFADLFAAFLHNDPNVTGNSLDEIGLHNTPSDYRRLSPAKSVGVAGWSEYEAHTLLTPARHYFGKNLFAKIKDQKQFLHELSEYFIRTIERPDASMFLSYKPLIAEVTKTQDANEMSEVFKAWSKASKINSTFRVNEILSFCESDFKACKSEIVIQLKRRQNGIFLTQVDPGKANAALIRAMEEIVSRTN